MAAAGIELETTLLHLDRDLPLECYFWPSKPGIPHDRLYIRAGSVASGLAKEARDFIEQQGVPQLVAWVSGILNLPYNSPVRRAEQHFYVELPRRHP